MKSAERISCLNHLKSYSATVMLLWINIVLPLLLTLSATTGSAPWAIEASLKTQIRHELVVLSGVVEEIKYIEFDPIMFSTTMHRNAFQYSFGRIAELLNNVTETLFMAESEQFDALNITFSIINATKHELSEDLAIASSFEEYSQDKEVTNHKTMKVLNTSVQGICETLRIELVRSTKPKISTYFSMNKPQTPINISEKLNDHLLILKTTINNMQHFARSFLNIIKQLLKEYDSIESTLNSTLSFNEFLPVTNVKVLQTINDINTTITTLNNTIFKSYSTIVVNSSVTKPFLIKVNKTVSLLQDIKIAFKELFQANAISLQSTGYRYSNQFAYIRGLDIVAEMAFQNASKFELCARKHNFVIAQDLAKYAKLAEQCIQRQLDNLPNIVLTIKEFLGPFRDIAFAPVQSLKSCSIAVGDKFCYPDFAATFLTPNQLSAEGPRELELLNQLALNIYFIVYNDIASAVDYIESCSFNDFIPNQMNKWIEKRQRCFNDTSV